jgi:hypothetical protein
MRSVICLVLVVLTSLLSTGMAFAQGTGQTTTTGKVDAKVKSLAQLSSNKTDAKKEPVKRAPSAPLEAPLAPQELSIAERVHLGHLACELGASVHMTADANNPGYFNLQGKGYKYRMKPVITSTGAIRLEDEKAGTVWLQLANKSMLMDQKKGRRLADECAHPDQVAFANDMKVNPPPALIDVSNTATSVIR